MGEDQDQGDKITLSKAELDALLEERARVAAMPEDEKRIRSIIGDEIGRQLETRLPKVLSDLFEVEPPAGGGKGPREEQRPGGASGLWDTLTGGKKADGK